MRLNSLANSSVFRLAAMLAALYSFAVVVTGAVIFFLTTQELEHRMRLGVNAEQARFRSVYEEQGTAGLKETVERYGDAIVAAEAVYLLLDARGSVVAGNVSPIDAFEGWKLQPDDVVRFTAEQSDDPDWYYLHGIRLGGLTLITGRSNEDVEEPQEIVLESIIWSIATILIIGLAGAVYLGRRAQARVDAIEQALRQVSAGNLATRIAAGTQNDDITRISNSINDATKRLQGLVESMQQISADIAHDLKTPIGRLRNKLEAARGNAATVADYEAAVDGAIEDVNSIVATFEALLRIAQIGAGARKSRFTRVGLKQILETIEEVYGPVAEEAGDLLTSSLDLVGSDIVEGDYELLIQMFANIVENAIRHCPKGSSIRIALERRKNRLVASVSDNGPGIPEADREKVFRRFYRVEKSRTTSGNGLGLSLVSAIAELHDAELALLDAAPGLRVEVSFRQRL